MKVVYNKKNSSEKSERGGMAHKKHCTFFHKKIHFMRISA